MINIFSTVAKEPRRSSLSIEQNSLKPWYIVLKNGDKSFKTNANKSGDKSLPNADITILPSDAILKDELGNIVQGWGSQSQFSLFPYFLKFSVRPKHTLAIERHVHIWQVSPLMSCGDTCQKWIRVKKIWQVLLWDENFLLTEKLTSGALVPPPRIITKRNICAYFDGLLQDCSNSIADALELLQSCAKPSIY